MPASWGCSEALGTSLGSALGLAAAQLHSAPSPQVPRMEASHSWWETPWGGGRGGGASGHSLLPLWSGVLICQTSNNLCPLASQNARRTQVKQSVYWRQLRVLEANMKAQEGAAFLRGPLRT